MSEVEETLKRIQSHKGVIGTIVVNAEETNSPWLPDKLGTVTWNSREFMFSDPMTYCIVVIPETVPMGIPIRTTLDNSTTVQYAGLLHQLSMKARSTVRDIDPQNDLTFLRIRSKKHEIMVAPDKEYLLIVIQNPSE